MGKIDYSEFTAWAETIAMGLEQYHGVRQLTPGESELVVRCLRAVIEASKPEKWHREIIGTKNFDTSFEHDDVARVFECELPYPESQIGNTYDCNGFEFFQRALTGVPAGAVGGNDDL